jgi:hypothetical protein
MTTEFTYCLTRVCLRTGQLTLPLSMRELFPAPGSVRAVDTKTGESFELHVTEAHQLLGVAPFLTRHGLSVNDLLSVRALPDGAYAITPLPRPKRPDYTRPEAQRELIDRIVEQAPLSEREIRALFPDLPPEFDLGAALQRDGRLTKYEGRWSFSVPDAVPAAPRPYPTVTTFVARSGEESFARPSEAPSTDTSLSTFLRRALETFGFRVETRAHGQLVAHAELGRRHYTVLAHLLAEGARLDWTKLLARRREVSSTYLAVFGSHHDLLRLRAPASGAGATLWSWEALERALGLLATVPMSPVDLEPHFVKEGLFDEGLRRFERTVERRVAERGAFSQVLSRLAGLRAPSVFLLDDLIDGATPSREEVLRVLELLGEAPFHLVSRVDSGEFCLRQGVPESLTHLSAYALSLVERMPERRTERVRGVAVVSAEK